MRFGCFTPWGLEQGYTPLSTHSSREATTNEADANSSC